ncbi:MAG TPA: hypothetical protein VJ994_00030 [Paracoccaceae bacterium]|nr:hypothetical protein [Paracoccaceae bacterium]
MTERKEMTPKEARRPPRRWLAYLAIGVSMLMAVGLALIVPIAEADANAFRWPALLPLGMAAMLGGGLAWLVLTIISRRRRR